MPPLNQKTLFCRTPSEIWPLVYGGSATEPSSSFSPFTNDVYARTVGPSGPEGPEVLVNVYTTEEQQRPSVAAAPGGNFVVTWTSRGGQDGSGALVSSGKG